MLILCTIACDSARTRVSGVLFCKCVLVSVGIFCFIVALVFVCDDELSCFSIRLEDFAFSSFYFHVVKLSFCIKRRACVAVASSIHFTCTVIGISVASDIINNLIDRG